MVVASLSIAVRYLVIVALPQPREAVMMSLLHSLIGEGREGRR